MQKCKKAAIINTKLILQRWADAYSATSSVSKSGDPTQPPKQIILDSGEIQAISLIQLYLKYKSLILEKV